MMTTYWNPWSVFDELDRTFFRGGSSEWPAFDIEDSEDATTLTADLPGMSEDDLEVTVDATTLVVRGERKPRDGQYLRRGRWYGRFERRFQLGNVYDTEDVKAHFANGELTIRLAKAAKAKPRRIKLGGVVDKVKGFLSGDKKAA